MQLSLDPITGQIALDFEMNEFDCQGFELRAIVEDLPPLERRVIRQLFGVGCEVADPSDVAKALGLSLTQLWLCVERAYSFIGQVAIAELAA